MREKFNGSCFDFCDVSCLDVKLRTKNKINTTMKKSPNNSSTHLLTRGGRDAIPIKNLTWHLTSEDRTVQRNRYRVAFSSWTPPTSPWDSAYAKLTFWQLRSEEDIITEREFNMIIMEGESPSEGSRRQPIVPAKYTFLRQWDDCGCLIAAGCSLCWVGMRAGAAEYEQINTSYAA